MFSAAFERRGLPAAAVAAACLALISGCASGAAGKPSAAPLSTTGTPASTGSAGLGTTCPSAAAISAAIGQTVPAPTKKTLDQTLGCEYSNAAGAIVEVTVSPQSADVAPVMFSALSIPDQDQNIAVTQVPGLDAPATAFTMDGAGKNPDHIPTTSLTLLIGAQDITIAADLPVAEFAALAHAVIGS